MLKASALSSPSSKESEDASSLLRAIHDAKTAFIAASVIQALSFVALAAVLAYLYSATKSRHPKLPNVALVMGIAGPILFGAANLVLDISRIGLSDDFVRGLATYTPQLFAEADAEKLNDMRDGVAVALGAGGTLGLAFSMVLLNVNAMRVGLVGRFLGVIGIIAGVLYVIPLVAGPVLQVFWLGALIAIFIDRYPGGRGPAWDSGKSMPWPSAAQRRGLAPGGGTPVGAAPADEIAANGEDPTTKPDGASGGGAAKRKRKRRR